MRGRLRLVALFADASDDEIGTAIKTSNRISSSFMAASLPPRRGRPGAFRRARDQGFRDRKPEDFAPVTEYDADMLLFDAKGARAGGNGAAFDWQLLRGRSFSRPWLLAGD